MSRPSNKRKTEYPELPQNRAALFRRAVIFFAVLALPALLWGILAVCGLSEKLSFDTNENRNMHEISENASIGNLTSELEAYYNDRVPFRSVLLRINKALNTALEYPYKHAVEPALLSLGGAGKAEPGSETFSGEQKLILRIQNKLLSLKSASVSEDHEHVFLLSEHAAPDYEHYGYNLYRCYCGEEKKEYIEKPVDESYFPYVEENVIQGRYGWLFFGEDIPDYTGQNLPDEDYLEQTASLLRNVQAAAAENQQTFFSISFPDKSRIYPEYMPTLEKADTWCLKVIADYLSETDNTPFYYPYDELINAKPKADLYYKLDTHWNYQGAFIGLNKIHEILGMPFIDPDTLELKEYTYTGDLCKMQSDPREETCLMPLYKPEVKVNPVYENTDGAYGFFSDGITEFYSDSDNDQTIVIIGDSFLTALMEYIPRDFAHAVFINRTSLGSQLPSFISDADVIVYEFVERRNDCLVPDLISLSSIMD